MRLDHSASLWEAIDRALYANGGDVTPEIQAMIDAVELGEKTGVDDTILSIRALEGDVIKWQRMEDQFAAKKRQAKYLLEQRKALVRAYMESRQLNALPGEILSGFALVNAGTPPVEVLVAVEDLPEEFVKKTLEPKLSVLGAALKAGTLGEGIAKFGEATKALRIV